MGVPFSFKIRKKYRTLRFSEQKVADILLKGDYRPGELTIEFLANEAKVSQPTVIRFAQAMGLGGFRELKTALIEEQARQGERGMAGAEKIPCQVTPGDKLVDVPLKVISADIRQLENTLKNLSVYELMRGVQALAGAKRVLIAAAENSCAVAEDMATKLIYMGIDAVFYQDVYRQSVFACNLDEKDVAVGISYTGVSESTVNAMRIAKEAGAATIAITNYENALINRYADILLCSGNEPYIYQNAVFSRCSQIAIVDMIYTGLLVQDYGRFSLNLETRSMIPDLFVKEEMNETIH
ncbi:MAG TPA: MurR/RpiR family transcriptional regulator [Candidatus Choladousia intestinigallinarum]|nr:MurR/RpiR family transcriptional regulator [Candidatus Choladousia intestinigallinarum]